MNIKAKRSRAHIHISEMLTSFVQLVKTENAAGRLDINLHAENILIPIFEELYGYEELKNLNLEQGNMPGIDLGDKDKKVAIQVTSDKSSAKIIHTLQKFEDSDDYDHLIIYIITEKQKSYTGDKLKDQIELIQGQYRFDKKTDIRDYTDLQLEIQNLADLDRVQKIEKILEKEFAGRPVFMPMIILAVSVTAILVGLIAWQSLAPERCNLAGTLNVAVAPFSNESGVTKTTADLVSATFYSQLSSEFEKLNEEITSISIESCGPDLIRRPIQGETVEQRALEAAQRAQELGIDLLIYGSISRQNEIYVAYNSEFYLQGISVEQSLGGAHSFGESITFSDNNRADLAIAIEEALRRSTAILLTTRGLSHYLIGDYVTAKNLFTRANDDTLWPSRQDREVLYLLIGNAEIRSGNLGLAGDAYQAALKLEPGYARGYIGLANVSYLRSLEADTCGAFDPDLMLLDEAQSLFEQASTAVVQPATADIPSKVDFGIAQVHLVHWFVNKDPNDLQEALGLFENVLNTYDHGANPRLMELASESHVLMALAFRESEDTAQAINHFNLGLDLAQDPARRAFIQAMLSRAQRSTAPDLADSFAVAAISDYKRAQSLTSQLERDAFFYREIARLYNALGQHAEAASAMWDAVSLLPEDDPCYAQYRAYYEELQLEN